MYLKVARADFDEDLVTTLHTAYLTQLPTPLRYLER